MEPDPHSFIFFLTIFPTSLVLGILALILLLFLSASVSGSEVAFFSLKKKDIDNAKELKAPKIELIQKLIRNRKKLLATILVANNFINIGIVLLSAYLSEQIIHPFLTDFHLFGIELNILFDIVVITFLLLLFGEIIPKIYSAKKPLVFSQFTAPAINIAQQLVKPISIPLMWLSGIIEKYLKSKQPISIDHLSHALELTSEDKTTTQEEQKILEGIVNFGNTETREIMTPRVDMFAVKTSIHFQELINAISENGYSRIPVYDENIDEIKGLIYAKDLLTYLNQENFDWMQIIRKPFFVPENKKLDDLLSDFQEKKTHLAIVVDEYGGTSGVVSLEDVLEEIVGDISDEFDNESIFYSKLDNNNFIFEGKTSLKDFFRIMEIENTELFEDNKGEAETLAGLILELSGDAPRKKQTYNLENFTFTIEDLDKKRIKRIKVSRTKTDENETDNLD